MYLRLKARSVLFAAVAALLAAILSGCPPSGGDPDSEYDAGFDVGFAIDAWYWDGYFDGWDTVDVAPIYYEGGEIPFVEDPLFEAGYWDGVWYAYNDGYFVDYHYAFIIGFSEGYDNAYWPDYLEFLAVDEHFEFENGGWSDGYHDGYSEGRVFGAYDFEAALPFDWLDALLDYESGTDLYFEEVDVGTGAFGPVILYAYGTDPNVAKSALAARSRGSRAPLRIRTDAETKDVLPDLGSLYRALDPQAEDDLDVYYSQSLRDSIELRLTTTWLERIQAYLNVAGKTGATVQRKRATLKD
jgi:hypothetical protein